MAEWRYRFLVNGVEIDRCRVYRPLRIVHGRSSITTQPDAPTTTFNWAGAEPPGQINDTFQIQLDLRDTVPTWIYDAPDSYTYDSPDFVWDNVGAGATTTPVGPRFTGEITGLTPSELGDGQVSVWEVQCTGRQARLGRRRVVGSFPTQTDVARVAAIATAVGMPISVRGTAGVKLVAAAKVDDYALDLLHQVCASSGGLLWQDRAGVIWYGAADHRDVDPLGVLSECAVAHGLGWEEALDQIINRVTASWGPDGATSDVTHQQDTSIDLYDEQAIRITTECATEADADELAVLILARRAYPYWTLADVITPIGTAPRPDQDTMAAADISTSLLVPISTTPGPIPAAWATWVVEGWIEEARTDRQVTLQLCLTDAARWVETRLRTWGEAAEATWDEEKAGSWMDALVVEVPA